jgi:hypothetical protein
MGGGSRSPSRMMIRVSATRPSTRCSMGSRIRRPWVKKKGGLGSCISGECRKTEGDGRGGLDRRHSSSHACNTDFMEFAFLRNADRGLSSGCREW